MDLIGINICVNSKKLNSANIKFYTWKKRKSLTMSNLKSKMKSFLEPCLEAMPVGFKTLKGTKLGHNFSKLTTCNQKPKL